MHNRFWMFISALACAWITGCGGSDAPVQKEALQAHEWLAASDADRVVRTRSDSPVAGSTPRSAATYNARGIVRQVAAPGGGPTPSAPQPIDDPASEVVTSSPGGDWLQFSSMPVRVTSFVGEERAFRIDATGSSLPSGRVAIGVIDRVGVITTDVQLQMLSESIYEMELKVSPNLLAGEYRGTLELRVCKDDPLVCKQPHAGSPWKLPYRISVKPSTNLTALRPLAGAQSWSTYQGGAAHNGYVNARVDPTTFSRRFKAARVASVELQPSIAVAGGGIVCLQLTPGTSSVPTMGCLNEASGQLQWKKELGGDWPNMSAPALHEGKLYFFTSNTGNHLWAVNAQDGMQIYKQALPYSGGYSGQFPPTIADNALFITGRGTSKFDLASGNLVWSAPYAAETDYLGGTAGSPGVYEGRITTLDKPGGLHVVDPDSGYSRTRFSQPGWDAIRYGGAPLMVSRDVVYFAGVTTDDRGCCGSLTKVNLTDGIAWSLTDSFASTPVVVGDTIYVRTAWGMQAHATSDGAVKWKWSTPMTAISAYQGFNRPLISASLVVVGKHAFVSSGEGTFAIDLETRQTVWSDPTSGALSVSPNGILYIAGTRSLVAVNLH